MTCQQNTNASLVICEDLTEFSNKIHLNSRQDAVNAAASLANCDLAPNGIRNEVYRAIEGLKTTPFPVENKIIVAQIICELMNSVHTPSKIAQIISAELEAMRSVTWNDDTVLKIAACIQAWDDSEEAAPTLFLADTNLTYSEECVINEALALGNREKASALLSAIKSGKAVGV